MLYLPQRSSRVTPVTITSWGGDVLSDPDARYIDLGADFHAKRNNPDRRKRSHIRQLEALGYTVTLTPTAA